MLEPHDPARLAGILGRFRPLPGGSRGDGAALERAWQVPLPPSFLACIDQLDGGTLRGAGGVLELWSTAGNLALHREDYRAFRSTPRARVMFFGSDADGDCDWRSTVATDFDLTGGTEIGANLRVECRDDPDPPDPWDNTDGEDWLSDMLTAVPTVCTGGMTHMSTLYDWLRYLWRMHDVQGLTVEEVFQIWANSHPETWDPNNSTALVLDDPWFRWDGAASSSFPTEHAAEEGAVDH